MSTVCAKEKCNGCMACKVKCPREAITVLDDISCVYAEIDMTKCVQCGLCYKVCPNNWPVKLKTPIEYKQGWAEEAIRKKSASGGTASAIIREFINRGGYVCSCVFHNSEFGFQIVNDVKNAEAFAGSRYVKSDPEMVYKRVDELLRNGEMVLFVGLPCQVAAMKNFVECEEKLYTIDLICHGTPSIRLLKKYIEEYGKKWKDVRDIQFRSKTLYGLIEAGKKLLPNRVLDCYMLCFLEGVSYTENCYSCNYATLDRGSDVTLGDSWSNTSKDKEKGISLVLMQTEKGKELIGMAKLCLDEVDLKAAIDANKQLCHPSFVHPGRKKFLKNIKAGKSFKYSTFMALPKRSIKQSLKYFLIKCHILSDDAK